MPGSQGSGITVSAAGDLGRDAAEEGRGPRRAVDPEPFRGASRAGRRTLVGAPSGGRPPRVPDRRLRPEGRSCGGAAGSLMPEDQRRPAVAVPPGCRAIAGCRPHARGREPLAAGCGRPGTGRPGRRSTPTPPPGRRSRGRHAQRREPGPGDLPGTRPNPPPLCTRMLGAYPATLWEPTCPAGTVGPARHTGRNHRDGGFG
jgi:hypothetical protein